ncbi:MAG: hypothetical protein ACOC4J_04295 [Bacteroidota bacterium]
MRAIRQIIEVKNQRLNIDLPNNFNAEKVEVIILPFEEKSSKKGNASLRGKLNLTAKQYKDFQEEVRNSREGWEINI